MGEHLTPALTYTVKRQDPVHVSPYCAERPYLELTVPNDAWDVLSVRFIVTSHDQGFCGTSRDVAPYDMSFTWFSVYADRVNGQKDPRRIKLQSNYRADGAFRTHDIVWDHSHPHEEKTKWLASLCRGDRLQLYPRAFYPAWVNMIQGAEMTVTYTHLDPQERAAMSSRASQMLQPRGGWAAMALEYASLSMELQEIRLLVVLPGAYDDDIRCRLTTVSLESGSRPAPQFEALSYCWGDVASDGGASITLLDAQGTEAPQQFRVSRAVERAVRRLRHADGRTRTLWIDSVCINQADLEERAQQVKIMHDIYEAAAQVDVWLGEGDERACMAVGILRDIYNVENGGRVCPGGLEAADGADGGCVCAGSRHRLSGADRDRLSGNVFQKMHQVFDAHSAALVAASGVHTESLYHAMAALFGISWFRRVWVLQEALAGRATVVHCGHESIPWAELVAVHALFGRADNPLSPLHSAPQALMPPLWEMLGDERDRTPPIVEVLLSGIEVEASDPRDKLFALLAFGRETGHRMRRLPVEIQPDYVKTAEQVFAGLTRWLLHEQRSLDVLSAAVHSQPGRTWQALHCPLTPAKPLPRPTWTFGPDGKRHWTYATLLKQFDFCAGGGAATPLDLALLDMSQDGQEDCSSDSSGRSHSRSHSSHSSHSGGSNHSDDSSLLLRLRGFRVGVVTQITAFPLDQVQQRCCEAEADDERCQRDWIELRDAFTALFDQGCIVKTWISSRVNARTEKGSFRDADPQAVIRDHMRAHWGYGPMPPNEAANLDRWENARYRVAASKAVPPCIGRCLMVLSDGKVGLCPGTAREGDVVVVLYGGKVPFLLRPTTTTGTKEARFELVGECFLRGIMHGEFVDAQLERGAVSDIFSLV